MNFLGHTTGGQTMIFNNNDLAEILRVCEIKNLIWVMRFQSPLVYNRPAKSIRVARQLLSIRSRVILKNLKTHHPD